MSVSFLLSQIHFVCVNLVFKWDLHWFFLLRSPSFSFHFWSLLRQNLNKSCLASDFWLFENLHDFQVSGYSQCDHFHFLHDGLNLLLFPKKQCIWWVTFFSSVGIPESSKFAKMVNHWESRDFVIKISFRHYWWLHFKRLPICNCIVVESNTIKISLVF